MEASTTEYSYKGQNRYFLPINVNASVIEKKWPTLEKCTSISKSSNPGKKKGVIRKALVDLKGPSFAFFESQRDQWMEEDDYLCPGPIQFNGPLELTDPPPLTLQYEMQEMMAHRL